MTAPQPLATVIQGSLSRGLEARLNPGVSVEDLRVGKFVVIQGERHRFFGLLTDVTLATSNPQILVNPPARKRPCCRRCWRVPAPTGLSPSRPC